MLPFSFLLSIILGFTFVHSTCPLYISKNHQGHHYYVNKLDHHAEKNLSQEEWTNWSWLRLILSLLFTGVVVYQFIGKSWHESPLFRIKYNATFAPNDWISSVYESYKSLLIGLGLVLGCAIIILLYMLVRECKIYKVFPTFGWATSRRRTRRRKFTSGRYSKKSSSFHS